MLYIFDPKTEMALKLQHPPATPQKPSSKRDSYINEFIRKQSTLVVGVTLQIFYKTPEEDVEYMTDQDNSFSEILIILFRQILTLTHD